ncbi:hypothetical protein, partial [Primorskyibacter sedentarius]|uniref:hypothetical protein n=1 Tax=Primorskyibacter sedentarius TaxID=745311 RepID=UPI001A9D8F15
SSVSGARKDGVSLRLVFISGSPKRTVCRDRATSLLGGLNSARPSNRRTMPRHFSTNQEASSHAIIVLESRTAPMDLFVSVQLTAAVARRLRNLLHSRG